MRLHFGGLGPAPRQAGWPGRASAVRVEVVLQLPRRRGPQWLGLSRFSLVPGASQISWGGLRYAARMRCADPRRILQGWGVLAPPGVLPPALSCAGAWMAGGSRNEVASAEVHRSLPWRLQLGCHALLQGTPVALQTRWASCQNVRKPTCVSDPPGPQWRHPAQDDVALTWRP